MFAPFQSTNFFQVSSPSLPPAKGPWLLWTIQDMVLTWQLLSNLAQSHKREDLHFIVGESVLYLSQNKKTNEQRMHTKVVHTLSPLATIMRNSLGKKRIHQRWQSREAERPSDMVQSKSILDHWQILEIRNTLIS